jgi:putative membrane protein
LKTYIFLIGLLAIAVPLSFIGAPYPKELVLQHTATVFGLICLTLAVVFVNATRLSFACISIFISLHIIGARWIYSYVPYDDVAKYLTGTTVSEMFGWQRNHYDRLVHFGSGLLGVAPASELLQKYGAMRPLGSAMMGVACIMTIGALYEIFEWQIAVQLAPDQAEAYNGQQGDIWDPQKDLLSAWLGSMIACLLLFRWSPKENVNNIDST